MRVTNGSTTRQRRKALKRKVEGAWGTKHTSFKIAKQTLIRAKGYAFDDRKQKKRDFRKLWIQRINSQVRALGYNYSTFMANLTKQNISINRKMLSEMAISNPDEFKTLVENVMGAKA
ncbi:MAG: 50S ribosomal protein L20 [Mycoplasmataceae bacterium]|nr:50S ribosomal protein L20 [Mycoplasmataceae bacterium]